MIVITYKMKNTVDNDSVKLGIEICLVKCRIVPDSIDTDEKVTGKNIPLAVIKSNDVSIVMMIEGSDIDIENVRVGTENDIDLTDAAFLSLGNYLQPSISEPPDIEFETCILK